MKRSHAGTVFRFVSTTTQKQHREAKQARHEKGVDDSLGKWACLFHGIVPQKNTHKKGSKVHCERRPTINIPNKLHEKRQVTGFSANFARKTVIKILSIDGTAPTRENGKNGTFSPLNPNPLP